MDRLHAMDVFARIVERGSLTAAADSLDLSLPSVVRSLAALERHLGVRLLNRTTRRIHLTDEGKLYLERSRVALAAVEEAEASITMRRAKPSGRLGVTAPALFGRRYVAPVAFEFLRRNAGVNVDLLLVDRVVNLVEEGFDVGVRIGALPDSSLVAVPVGNVRRVICASPAWIARNGLPRAPSDLRAHRCVGFGGLTPGRDWIFGEGRKRLVVPVAYALTCNQVEAALEACIAGVGPGAFLSYQVVPQRQAKSLRYVLEAYEPPALPVHLVYPHAKLVSPAVRAFLEACQASLRGTGFA